MIFNQTNTEGLRDLFCIEMLKIFRHSNLFLDFIENGEYSNKYDCFVNYDDENYIINRETGEYVNWYKFCNIGRDVHISINQSNKIDISKWIYDFLVDFKRGDEVEQ